MGGGRYALLKSIQESGSLKKSAKHVGICEKTAHNYIRRMEKRLRSKIAIGFKGGKDGGGHVLLTNLGQELIMKYEEVQDDQ